MKRREFLKTASAVGATAALSNPLQGAQSQSSAAERYPLSADSKAQPGVPVGKLFNSTMDESKFYPGTRRTIDVYIPAQYKAINPACIWIELDGIRPVLPPTLGNLIHRNDVPPMIAVGLNPGATLSADVARNPRHSRSFKFDSLTDVLARFIMEEMLPAVGRQKTTDGLPIVLSRDPNDCGITGASSGGIGAVTAASSETLDTPLAPEMACTSPATPKTP